MSAPTTDTPAFNADAAPTVVVQQPAPAGSRQLVASVEAWSANKRHIVTLPSGTAVAIEIPDLPNMIRAGDIPNNLISIAIGVANGKKVTADDISEQAAFYNKLVSITVAQPQVTEQQVETGVIPAEDKEMLVELAVRQRDFDARGHHVGGLETDADFRTFRGLLPLDAFGEGV